MLVLVIFKDCPKIAGEIGRDTGMTQEWAINESRRFGYKVGVMNRFIRKELRPADEREVQS